METNGIILEHKDYLSGLNRARRECGQNIDPRYLLLLLTAAILVGLAVVGAKTVKKPAFRRVAEGTSSQEGQIATPAQVQTGGSLSSEEEATRGEEEEIDKTISSYIDLSTVQVLEYLNIRGTLNTDSRTIDKLSGDGACEILGTEGGQSHIILGGMGGYISN